MSGYSQPTNRYSNVPARPARPAGRVPAPSSQRQDVVPFSQLRPSAQGSTQSPKAAQNRAGQGRPGQGAKASQGAKPGQFVGQRSSQQGGQAPPRRPQQNLSAPPRAVQRRDSPQQLSQAVRQEPLRTYRGRQFVEPSHGYADDGFEDYQPNRRVRRGGGDDRYFENFDMAPRRNSQPAKPTEGWRAALMRATGFNLGPSSRERRMQEAIHALRAPVDAGTVAIFSRKGGVGKTTITAYLGATLASMRGGRVVAIDGDAEAGSLGWLMAPRAPSTLPQLAAAQPPPRDFRELRGYVAGTESGLDVVVGEPAENGVLGEGEMQRVVDIVSRHYDLSLFDTGAGVTRATGRVLVHSAKTLLLVMGPSVDSVRAAERTLAWLDEYPGQAAHPDAQVIAVINGIPSDSPAEHIERIESHFVDRCAEVVRIPWDRYLSTGASNVSLESLDKETRDAFVELAAATVGTLATSRRRGRMRRAS